MPAAAIVAAGVIAAGASVYAANKSSKAAESAAQAQLAGADAATRAQLEMYYQSREDTAPWRAAGTAALNKLMGTSALGAAGTAGTQTAGYWTQPEYTQQITGYRDVPMGGVENMGTMVQEPIYGQVMTKAPQWVPGTTTPGTAATTGAGATQGLLTAGPGEFKESPSYQFTLGEGMKGIQRAASASGRLASGNYLRDVTKYAEGLASTEYDNFLARYYKSLDPWLSMAGMGQTSAGQSAQNALTTGQNLAQTALYGGQVQAAGNLGAAYPWSQLAGTAGNYLGQYAMNRAYQQPYQQPTNALMPMNQYWSQAQYTPQQMNTMGWL